MVDTRAVTILVLAAGASRRMGGQDKLLRKIGGEPLLARGLRRASQTGARVVVALLPAAPERTKIAQDLGACILTVPDAATGLSAAFRAFAARYGDGEPVLVVPADMPDISAADMNIVMNAGLAALPACIARGASVLGIPGHPVFFPADQIKRFASLRGDTGAKSLLKGQKVIMVPLPGTHATTDLDTPDAWGNYLAQDAKKGG